MNRLVIRRSVLSLTASLVLVSPALAAPCGGGIPCSCGDFVAADHTLICGVDPVTVDPCRDDPATSEFEEDGLTVARNVNLNLGGCRIRGADGGIGIRLDEGASVEAGQIVGFDIGVSGFNPEIVRRLRVTDTSLGGIVVTDPKLVERNVVERTGGIGIQVDAVQSVVRQNRIEDSEGCGIVVVGFGGVVDHNLVLRGGECGIRISEIGHTVTRNQVKYTQAGPGFLFINAQQNHVSSNSSWAAEGPAGAGSPGFLVRNLSEQNTFQRNVSSHNDGFGIEDHTGVGLIPNTYYRNLCVGNALGKSSPPGLCP